MSNVRNGLRFQPRGEFILFTVVDKGKIAGTTMHAPQSSSVGKAHYIEAVGEDVKGLKPGDRVCIIGSKQSETWIPLPDAPDLYMTRQSNAVVIITEVKEGEA